jgi:DNA replication and repair protein RecF
MVIRTLSALHYRNLNEIVVDFSEGVNLLYGDNGQGKTNLVESIYFITHLDSFRTGQLAAVIQNGQRAGHIQARIDSRGQQCKATVEITPRGRRVWLDDVPIRRLSEYVGRFFSIVFNPENLFAFRQQPHERRMTLDRYLSFLEPEYVAALREFRAIHAQKNQLLKAEQRPDLADWNGLFAQKCYTIGVYRRDLIAALNPLLSQVHQRLVGRASALRLVYQPSLGGSVEDMRERLAAVEPQEVRSRFALFGVHRDDMQLVDGTGRQSEQFSQGEFRLALLALKLAMSEYLAGRELSRPVLIFDDVFSELDQTVHQRLTEELTRLSNQIFITATDRQPGDRMPGARIMEIRDGNVLDEERYRR